MHTDPLKPSLLALVPAFGLFLVIQACGGSDDAFAADSDKDPVEGVWSAVVTRKDCATGAALSTFRGTQVLHRGGTVTDTNSSAPTSRGPGFGVWTKSGDVYTIRFRFLTYDASGASTGSNRVTKTFTMSADGQTLTNTIDSTVEIYNPAEVKVAAGCANDVSTRVY